MAEFLTQKAYGPTTTSDASMSSSISQPQPWPLTVGQFPGDYFVLGGGVAIFHIATGRVVICSARDRRGKEYYFLPKGRRDAGEESGRGAEREGYEEVGGIFEIMHHRPANLAGM
jgi:hypothetical protein